MLLFIILHIQKEADIISFHLILIRVPRSKKQIHISTVMLDLIFIPS